MQDLQQLEEDISKCEKCALYRTRTLTVPGEGNPNADIMFIGEGPGANEDQSGRPFCGRAGEILTRIIENCLGLKREDVFITNIVKCRPPNNRDPELREVLECATYLDIQISLVAPKVIIALGKPASKRLCDRTVTFKENMAYFRAGNDGVNQVTVPQYTTSEYNGPRLSIPLVCTWHPAYILRQGERSKAAFEVRDDMELVKNVALL